MKKILLVLLIACGLMSCLKKETFFKRSYITNYKNVTEIELEGSPSHFSVLHYGGSIGSFQSIGELKETFDALCEKHGDMTYNRKVTEFQPGEQTVRCIGVDFTSIDIVSDSDFDAEHPAGSSLGDIVLFLFQSLKPYIDSGYTLKTDRHKGFMSFEYLISEIPQGALTMMGGYSNNAIGGMKFQSQPTLSKTHTFTVTMTADDGRVFTDSIEMSFE
jgi:hypothetical protein